MPNRSSAKRKFTCPHCGAVYEVSASRRGRAAYHTATCSYCGDVMAEWNGPARHYHRIKRPRTATQLAKIVDEVAASGSGDRKRRRAGRERRGFVASPETSAVRRTKRASVR